jgi:hypothetical protein
MYNDPSTGQFQWGNVIQDIIRNYMMMQMLGQGKDKPPDPLSQAATVGPVGGQGGTLPGISGQPPPNPQMLQDPQLMQLIMQLFMGR